jgi:hypothetical protein
MACQTVELCEVIPVGRDIREELEQALDQVDRPGSFCAVGSAPTILPGLEVHGLGPIGLPLTVSQAKELIKRSEQAPHGKGEQTLVDTKVRRVWRLKPDRLKITNPEWKGFMERTDAKVQEELGLEKQKLQGHLYDLLLYERGGFFLPHRDGEKLDRMVATLVVVLPSAHEGGELVVRHEGQERVIDFGGPADRKFHIHFAAFYADCEHEVRPLKKGYRLCLVYNLTLAKAKKHITAPRASGHVEEISTLLRQWSAGSSAEKLVITLEHQYSQEGLAWDALKGVDRARARILADAARQAGCKVYLGLLTFWESGEGEDEDYPHGYGSGRWYDDEDDDVEDQEDEDEDEDEGRGLHRMVEVIETSLTMEHLAEAGDIPLPIGKINIKEKELLDPEGLRDVTPEEEYQGYTGNEGTPLDRWYRHAALVVWPVRKHFRVICERDSRDVLPVLEPMVARWRKARGDEAAALKEQCTELSAAIIAKWPEVPHRPYRSEEAEKVDALETIAQLDDPQLIGDYLRKVMTRDTTVEPGNSVVKVCQAHGWGTFRDPLIAVVKATARPTVERNVRLLERICTAKPRKEGGWGELCTGLAKAMVEATEAVDRGRSSDDWGYRALKREDILAGLARALLATEQEDLLSRVLDHARSASKKYPLIEVHVPAIEGLRPWLKRHLKKRSSALTRWIAWCRERLEALTARPPAKFTDLRRPAHVTCKCGDCAELRRFLEDAGESVHRFAIRQDRRNHLEQQIREHKLDVDCATIRRSSPHVLVCTKNDASYQTRLADYHRNQRYLASIREIQDGLPR